MAEVVRVEAGGVNCYLLRTGGGFVLIDTGFVNRRTNHLSELRRQGLVPGELRLVVLTHADFDHACNSLQLQQEYGARIAAHPLDAEAVARGDMLLCRENKASLVNAVLGMFKYQGCNVDLLLADGQDLSPHGLEATALHLPGHTLGSLGVLTPGGDLFCGDLLTNTPRPTMNINLDNRALAAASLQRLKGLGVKTVYPGHGRPFAFDSVK